ncbi:plant UBX domain-containing protein 7-like [Tasmannia lanceolata]|uniref:plant UBX domain-containing protein 7-like n=1 Tax=Tasmannia lanceolata TaxID=3420 RepID=UPI0040631AA9
MEKQVSSQSAKTAPSWNAEEAIELFYGDGLASSSFTESVPADSSCEWGNGEEYTEWENHGDEYNEWVGHEYDEWVGDEYCRWKNDEWENNNGEILYDNRDASMGYPSEGSNSLIAFQNSGEELTCPSIWESDQNSTSTTDSSRDNLATLYRPPLALMYHGTFDKAKMMAALQDKWLLVNLQSTKEFSSHILNRDTWGNEALAQTISNSFIFWQVHDDSREGMKVCTYYKLASFPVVLVIDPITGQKMRLWNGVVQPESLLEDLTRFMDKAPKDHLSLPYKRPQESSLDSTQKILVADEASEEEDEDFLLALAVSMGSLKDPVISTATSNEEPNVEVVNEEPASKIPSYPSLPEEPRGDRSCRVAIRLPDGQRIQRNFLRTDPLKFLWSFCCSELKEAETRPFRLALAIPGASNYLDYENKLTFDESGLSNSMISMTWG